MQIILIGNYPLDLQESMVRFAEMLNDGFNSHGIECSIWKPNVVLGRYVRSTVTGFGKWIGYIDKWIVFPCLLRFWLLKRKNRGLDIRFHICDHSNSPYFNHLPKHITSVTCHDVLAIRGALGYADAFCPATRFGKVFQKWISSSLIGVKKIACISQATLNQLRDLSADNTERKEWSVIHMALNASFSPLEKKHADIQLKRAGISEVPYLLNVGSNLKRKNRKLLIDMLKVLGDRWSGNVCFAGQPADDELLNYAKNLGLGDRIVSVAKPEHEILTALYSKCEAFIFPSFSEGFGWPLIEAQACGAPVIASNIEPVPEVGGKDTALYADPGKPQEFANAFLSLSDTIKRDLLVKKGLENVKRFDLTRMIDSYLKLIELK